MSSLLFNSFFFGSLFDLSLVFLLEVCNIGGPHFNDFCMGLRMNLTIRKLDLSRLSLCGRVGMFWCTCAFLLLLLLLKDNMIGACEALALSEAFSECSKITHLNLSCLSGKSALLSLMQQLAAQTTDWKTPAPWSSAADW